MKILLSAYSCEPNRGSEPGIGWHWATELAQMGHLVSVLTQRIHRRAIHSELERHPLSNLSFIFYELPFWPASFTKRGWGVRLHYVLWQWGAYALAKRANIFHRFDLAHHITFGVIRHPSFMGRLGIPFILGPLGGAERAPVLLRRGYSTRGSILDAIRDLSNFLARLDPLIFLSLRRARLILATTPQSKAQVPKQFHKKTIIHSAIGIDSNIFCNILPTSPSLTNSFKILYVGRFIYWKGMHLGIPAFAKLLRAVPGAKLTMVGEGTEEARWRNLAHRIGVERSLEWVPWISQCSLSKVYTSHHVFLFPSLHDSGGSVVLEAMAYGLPVVCFALGGPSLLVDESCGSLIEVRNLTEAKAIARLSQALLELATDDARRRDLSRGALIRARQHTWQHTVQNIYTRFPLTALR